MKLNLEHYTTHGDNVEIRPVDNIELFRHCAGSLSILPKDLDRITLLLMLHGVTMITVDGTTE